MRKPPFTFCQSLLLIGVGAALHFLDCLFQHTSHPEVSWIQSGIYANYGLLFNIACLLTGVYGLAKLCE